MKVIKIDTHRHTGFVYYTLEKADSKTIVVGKKVYEQFKKEGKIDD